MYKSLCFVVSSAFAIIVTALPVFAQTVPPTAMASSPAYVVPKGTGVITGRVVYEGGQPAAGVGVVAAIQTHSWLAMTMPYMAQHGGTIRDKKGKAIGFSFVGGLPGEIERIAYVSSVTDADGKYSISGVTTAGYNIFVTAPHQSRWTQVDKPSDSVAAADEGVQAVADQTIPAPDLMLTHGAIIQGQVVEAVTDRPLRGIIVKAHGPERPASSAETITTVTDSEGRYMFRVAAGRSSVGTDGVRLDNGEEHDHAMKIDNALWSVENDFEAVVDGGTPQKKDSPVDTVSVETEIGQTHQIVFRLRRGKLQYSLNKSQDRAK